MAEIASSKDSERTYHMNVWGSIKMDRRRAETRDETRRSNTRANLFRDNNE